MWPSLEVGLPGPFFKFLANNVCTSQGKLVARVRLSQYFDFFVYRVPSMVADLVDSSATGHALDALMFGGAPAPILLAG